MLMRNDVHGQVKEARWRIVRRVCYPLYEKGGDMKICR